MEEYPKSLSKAMDRILTNIRANKIAGGDAEWLDKAIYDATYVADSELFASASETENTDANFLTVHDLAALKLYTAAGEGEDSSLFSLLNKALRTGDSLVMAPYVPMAWLLIHAMKYSPKFTGRMVYKAYRENLHRIFHDIMMARTTITWKAFTSTTSKKEILISHLGQEGPRTLFQITLNSDNARVIMGFSSVKGSDEVLLPPQSTFTVTSTEGPNEDGLYIVNLAEVTVLGSTNPPV